MKTHVINAAISMSSAGFRVMCFCSFKDLKTKLEVEVATQCIVIKKRGRYQRRGPVFLQPVFLSALVRKYREMTDILFLWICPALFYISESIRRQQILKTDSLHFWIQYEMTVSHLSEKHWQISSFGNVLKAEIIHRTGSPAPPVNEP